MATKDCTGKRTGSASCAACAARVALAGSLACVGVPTAFALELPPPAPADPVELFIASVTSPRVAALEEPPAASGGRAPGIRLALPEPEVQAAACASGAVCPQEVNSVVLVKRSGAPAAASSGSPSGKESDEIGIELKEADASLARKSDGGLVLASKEGVSLVGFYGYGGLTRGSGYHFTGTGYTGASGTSRVIPASLLLAGFTADPRQNIYSAEMRAEAAIPVSKGAEIVPYAGFRTVLTQDAEAGVLGAVGGVTGAGGEGDRRSVQQIPVGVGLRIERQADPVTRLRLKSSLGAVANLGDAGTASPGAGYTSYSGSSLSGIGAIGIEIERGDWSLGAGADVGVTTDDKTETGFSVNLKRKF